MLFGIVFLVGITYSTTKELIPEYTHVKAYITENDYFENVLYCLPLTVTCESAGDYVCSAKLNVSEGNDITNRVYRDINCTLQSNHSNQTAIVSNMPVYKLVEPE
ncbi:hypothetical protein DN748_09760 [Sinomicrobium soli]|nr:hypothetical protein DN748_09760 [Sinomicrobium sp. N-1-3-6]